ncbi:MAG: hypothetical protein ACUVXI_10845 [bacterium]
MEILGEDAISLMGEIGVRYAIVHAKPSGGSGKRFRGGLWVVGTSFS